MHLKQIKNILDVNQPAIILKIDVQFTLAFSTGNSIPELFTVIAERRKQVSPNSIYVWL